MTTPSNHAVPDKNADAIVLLSGGIDSATCLALALEQVDHPDRILAVHITYGQQTESVEWDRACRLAEDAGIEQPAHLDYTQAFSHFAEGVASDRSSFTTDDGELEETDGRSTGYVPMRNLLLIGTASAIADVTGAEAVYHGAQGGDEESYPDCRPEFMESMSRSIDLSTPETQQIELRTPLIDKTKPEVIQLASSLGVPLEFTYSCYRQTDLEDPSPCGDCPACVERIEAFAEAGIEDPILRA